MDNLEWDNEEAEPDGAGRWRKEQIDNKYGHARALWKRGYHRQNAVKAGLEKGWDKTKCPVLSVGSAE